MSKGTPINPHQISIFRAAGNGFNGEIAQEKIAMAVLQYPEFRGKEITVWDVTGRQVYFRLGKGRHGDIVGVHVHLPFEPFRRPGTTKAGSSKDQDQIVALVGDPKRPGSVHDYVTELLKALEQGRYHVGFDRD